MPGKHLPHCMSTPTQALKTLGEACVPPYSHVSTPHPGPSLTALLCPTFHLSLQLQPPTQDAFYRVAAQIKLLFEIPEKIWSCLEASQHLQATQLHLLCCRLHQLLQLQASGAPCSPILSRFPILIRQVAAASHFR